ncbi:Rab 5 [Cardiosporidium cionae]|uniref:Rab 5 n=1 Tax=Cardiosporidium cionae TaxID=476202 RepID=A0ABQ7JBQ2_9APIC|nr:Rab 5 [Cardiosporidium cionae]|eukprot:KAF8821422.1 Rab 5 [Cardiosporidium cionae]
MGCSLASNSLLFTSSGVTLASETASSSLLGISKHAKDAKVVLLGESGVGKSSLALRFCQGRFSPFHEVTIGAAFLQQTILLSDGRHLKLHIWDTGGQERFRSIAPLYYNDVDGAVIVYDSNYLPSFEAIKYWISELRNNGPANCCLVVAANKSDLAERQVSTIDGKEFCKSESISFVECSAKNGENVGSIFEEVAKQITIRNDQRG